MSCDRKIGCVGLDAWKALRWLASRTSVVALLSMLLVGPLASSPAPGAAPAEPPGGQGESTTAASDSSGSMVEETKMEQAKGTFEVKLAPMELHEGLDDPLLGRMSIDKRFEGDLEGTSRGEMLSARTAIQSSAGYVAVEKVSGTLAGRTGTFVLQHSSTMRRGEPAQSIRVVPDSGTGELEGLEGTMVIEIEGGEHRYAFDYRLSEP